MSTRYPNDGLSNMESAILERAGWQESTTPPLWVNSATGETLHPRSALMRVMDELQRHVEQS